MAYLFIKHEVDNIDKWKMAYDAHKAARDHAGLKELYLLHNRYNHNEVFILFEAANEHKAQDFIESKDLQEAMKKAGVVGQPEIRLMDEV
jgi:heme-degrading monooxygenase HmoA